MSHETTTICFSSFMTEISRLVSVRRDTIAFAFDNKQGSQLTVDEVSLESNSQPSTFSGSDSIDLMPGWPRRLCHFDGDAANGFM